MRLYACQYCSLTLHYDNVSCIRCHSELGYWAETDTLCVLEPVLKNPGLFTSWSVPGVKLHRCENSRYVVCNWLVDADGSSALCTACRHNRIVPDVTSLAGRMGWQKLESAKHRLFVAFHRLGLVGVIDQAGIASLGFLFLQDPPVGSPIMTGHAFGLITVALAEADDLERERRRTALGEPYRTLLGHFRHESAHYFWDRLVRDRGRFEEFRATFGDETADYQAAVQRYYLSGPAPNWQASFVSAYATMHPWEDFAETWAHYLHMIATLDTAHAYQLRTAPFADRSGSSHINDPVDPFVADDFHKLITIWLPLTTLLNSLNAAVGKDDAYPFVLGAPVIAKLAYIHGLIRNAVSEAAPNDPTLVGLLNAKQSLRALAALRQFRTIIVVSTSPKTDIKHKCSAGA